MSHIPTISVVCPTFNSEAYIENTLESILTQQLPPYEVIVSDDGSSDGTIQKLKQFQQQFEQKNICFKIIENLHRGAGATRNSGVFAAQGEWIAFADADDPWKPEKLSVVSQAIQSSPDTNFFLHWIDYLRLNGEVILIPNGNKYNPDLPFPRQIYRRNFLPTPAVVCKKDLIVQVGGFDEDPAMIMEDYELWLKLSHMVRLKVIEQSLVTVVERGDSISAKHYWHRYVPTMKVLLRHWEKGGLILFAYRILRTTINKQWHRAILMKLKKQQGHTHWRS
ncbi:MAG: glycosyltransferase family 2 protein [SAR324 cluster bacterium]|nr:glycosyltransferase family 2 protein [SAR324 cluster bacterium]